MYDSSLFDSINDSWNINSTTTTTAASSPEKLSTWYQERLITVYACQACVCLAAVIINIINVTVFRRAGIKDSITVSFVGLACSDLMHTSLVGAARFMTIARFCMGVHFPVLRTAQFNGLITWFAVFFMDISIYITVYAGLQKCFCVVFPFAFKRVFTARRSVVVILLIIFLLFIFYIPVIFYPTLDILIDIYSSNTTKRPFDFMYPRITYSPIVYEMVQRVCVIILSQTILTICVVIITVKLRQSVRFRQTGDKSEVSRPKTDPAQKDQQANNGPGEITLGVKELRAIQAVRLITIIFIVTTLPASANSVAIKVDPWLAHPMYQDITLNILYSLAGINATLNMFVYLKYNRKYKTIYKEMLCGCSAKKE